MAIVAPLLAGAAKYGPTVGRFAMSKLPWITGGVGALSQRDRGLGGMIQGGILGGVTGMGLGGPLKGLTTRAAGKLGGVTQLGGYMMPASVGAGLSGLATAGIPLAAAGALGVSSGGVSGGAADVAGQAANAVGGGASRVGGAGAGWVIHNTVTGETVPLDSQSALPGGLGQYGHTPAIGNVWDQIDPLGQYSGRRTGKILDAQTTAKEINILAPTIRKWAEQAKKDEMTRQLAAAGVRQNIATNAELNRLSAAAAQQQATTGLAQTGNALTQQYTYA